METLTIAPVTFTANALAELKRVMSEDSFDRATSLRVGVKGGGCSGLSYVLGFDALQSDDDTYEIDGIKFVVKPAHAMYLMGMEIDWQTGLNARGFTFKNPNASKTCGCGSSFAV